MKKLGYLVIALVLLNSCSPRIQFTQALKEQHQVKDEEMKKLQFYTSGDIVMQRVESSGSNKETNEGQLVITSGNSLERVVIKAGTPGIVESVVDNNSIKVRFEMGDGKTLTFGNTQANKGAYYLIADENRGTKKIVNYGGKKYALSGNSAYVSLSFKMRKLNKFSKEQHVAKGMKVK